MTQFEIDGLAGRADVEARPLGGGGGRAVRAAWPFLVRAGALAGPASRHKSGAEILSELQGEAGIGQREQPDRKENAPRKGEMPKQTFGEEGTNRTQAKPDPNAKPSDVGAGGKFIATTPFRR